MKKDKNYYVSDTISLSAPKPDHNRCCMTFKRTSRLFLYLTVMSTQNRHVNKTISDDYRLRYHCGRGADLNAFRSVERSYSGEKNTTATDLSTYNHHFKRYRKQYDKSYRKQYDNSYRN